MIACATLKVGAQQLGLGDAWVWVDSCLLLAKRYMFLCLLLLFYCLIRTRLNVCHCSGARRFTFLLGCITPGTSSRVDLAQGLSCFCLFTHLLKGKRYIMPNTRVMLHHPSGTARGQASDIHNEARELLYLRDYMNAILSEVTGHPYDKVCEVFTLCKLYLVELKALRLYCLYKFDALFGMI